MKMLLQIGMFCMAMAQCHVVRAFTAGTAQTLGEPWPMPAMYQPTDTTMFMSQFNFKFTVTGEDCSLLRGALSRYFKLIFYAGSKMSRSKRSVLKFYQDYQYHYESGAAFPEELTELQVRVQQKCGDGDYPMHGMDESCGCMFSCRLLNNSHSIY